MRGVVTTKEVLGHFRIIWREYGASCAFRCLHAIVCGKPTTFLDVVFRTRR